MTYSWPGNVRELKSAFEYAFVSCQQPMIQPYHFPPDIHQRPKSLKTKKKAPLNREEMKKKQLSGKIIFLITTMMGIKLKNR